MVQLVNLSELKTYLQINNNVSNNLLTVAINSASAAAESYCGRNFNSALITEFHDGGKSSIFLNRLPINNVTSVFEYSGSEYLKLEGPVSSTGELINTTSNTATIGYTYNSQTGQMIRSDGLLNFDLSIISPRAFTAFQNGVKVTYNGGYDIIPDDLKMAVMDYAKIIYKQEQNSPSSIFQGESMQRWTLSANFPPHIRRILDLYKIL